MATNDFPSVTDTAQAPGGRGQALANRPTAPLPAIDPPTAGGFGHPLPTPTTPNDADAASRAERQTRHQRNRRLLGRQSGAEMNAMLV